MHIISKVLLGLGSLILLYGFIQAFISFAIIFCCVNEMRYYRVVAKTPRGFVRGMGLNRPEQRRVFEIAEARIDTCWRSVRIGLLILAVGCLVIVAGAKL